MYCVCSALFMLSNSGKRKYLHKHKKKTSFFTFHSNGLLLLSVDASIKFHSKKFGSINLNPKTHSHLPQQPIIINYIYFQRLRGNSSTTVITSHFWSVTNIPFLSLLFFFTSSFQCLNIDRKEVEAEEEEKKETEKNGIKASKMLFIQ